jgi:membrane protein DedA with SNARE-associated domain
MSRSQKIVFYIVGFAAWFGAVLLFAYLLGNVTIFNREQFPAVATIIVGVPVAFLIVFVPIFFLKQLSRLSRKVEGDDSDFNLSRFSEHQKRPHVNYEDQ